MLSSKEALEKLYNNLGCEECNNYKCKCKQSTINDCDVWRNTIKQDLERLEELKDLEEELGIDLLTLFKALKDGIFALNDNYECG